MQFTEKINTQITIMESHLTPANDRYEADNLKLCQVSELNRTSIWLLNGLIEFKELILRNVKSCRMFTRLKNTESKILNLMAAIEQGIITPFTKSCLTKLENLKVDLEYKIASHKARNFKFTKPQLKKLFNSMDIENSTKWQEKQAIIKNLIERIYVWEDKILLLFNYSNHFNEPEKRKKDIQDIVKTVTENKCSVTVDYGGANASLVEHKVLIL